MELYIVVFMAIILLIVIGIFVTNILLITTRYQQSAVEFKDSQKDSFGRLRVSNPIGEIDSSNILGVINVGQNTTLTGGSGTIALIPNSPTVSIKINKGGLSSSFAKFQSRKRGVYQPGKSLLIYMTGVINPKSLNQPHFIGRMGYYDDDNGIYLQQKDGNETSFVLRSNVSGTVVETVVPQSNWNQDKCDGTGSTKFKLNPATENILIIDLEWLGVGSVRCGFVVNDTIHYCHIFENANKFENIYMYMATLPVRYEALTDGTTSSGSVNSNCYSIISEGGSSPDGKIYSYNRDDGLVILGADNTDYHPLVVIKLDTTGKNKIVQLSGLEFSTVSTSGASLSTELRMYVDANDSDIIDSPTFFSPFMTSSALVDNTSTDLIVPVSTPPLDYVIMVNNFTVADNDAQNNIVHSGINEVVTVNLSGQSNLLVLCVKKLNGNSDETVFGSLTWNEIS